jgi:hypothetical protein
MQEPEEIKPSRRELPDALQGLEPAPLRGSAREIWFRAGLEVGRRRANSWRAAASVAIVAAALVVAWQSKRTPIQLVTQNQPVLPSSSPHTDTNAAVGSGSIAAYVRLTDALAVTEGERQKEVGSSGGQPERRPWPFDAEGEVAPQDGLYPNIERGGL